jgi:septal ring factor EnvC (AmiA/AmiB activator)
MSEAEHSEDIGDLTREIARLEKQLKEQANVLDFKFKQQELELFAAAGTIAQLTEQRETLSAVVNTATLMIDQLLSDLRVAGGTPSAGLLLAKGRFDIAMKKLLTLR